MLRSFGPSIGRKSSLCLTQVNVVGRYTLTAHPARRVSKLRKLGFLFQCFVQLRVIRLKSSRTRAIESTDGAKGRLYLILSSGRSLFVDLIEPEGSASCRLSSDFLPVSDYVILVWSGEARTIMGSLREVASCFKPEESICLGVHRVARQVTLSPHVARAKLCGFFPCELRRQAFCVAGLLLYRILVRRDD